jgi:hypothetical protein
MTGGREDARPRVPERAIIALYPRRWRHRYRPELEALARDRSFSRARLLVDLWRGAVDARSHPELVLEPGVAQPGPRRALHTTLMATTTVGLVVGGLVKLSEDRSFGGASLAVDLAGAGAALACAAGAAVLLGPLVATLRWSIATRRADALARLACAPAAAGLWLLVTLLVARSAGTIHGDLLAGLVFFAWCGSGCVLAWAGAHAAGRALALAEVPLPTARLGRGVWGVVAGAMVALGGTLLWGLLATAHAGFGAAGLGGLPLGPVWVALLVSMSAALVVLWRVAQRTTGARPPLA